MSRLNTSQYDVFSQLRLPLIILVTYAHSYGCVAEGYSVFGSGWDLYEMCRRLTLLIPYLVWNLLMHDSSFYLYVASFNKSILIFHDTEKLHPTAPPTAMAQKHICLCTDLFQQQSVENRFFRANGSRVRRILLHIQFYLLLQ